MSSHLLRRRDLPFQKNLKIVVGDSFESPTVRLMSEDSIETSLSGYTITAGLKADKTDTSDIQAFTVSVAGGAVTLSLTDVETSGLSAYELLYYDVRYVDPLGDKTTYWAGYAEVEDV